MCFNWCLQRSTFPSVSTAWWIYASEGHTNDTPSKGLASTSHPLLGVIKHWTCKIWKQSVCGTDKKKNESEPMVSILEHACVDWQISYGINQWIEQMSAEFDMKTGLINQAEHAYQWGMTKWRNEYFLTGQQMLSWNSSTHCHFFNCLALQNACLYKYVMRGPTHIDHRELSSDLSTLGVTSLSYEQLVQTHSY